MVPFAAGKDTIPSSFPCCSSAAFSHWLSPSIFHSFPSLAWNLLKRLQLGMCLSTPKNNPWPAKCPKTSRAVFYTGIGDVVALWKPFSCLPGSARSYSGSGKERKAAVPGAQPGPLPGSRTGAEGRSLQWGRGVQKCFFSSCSGLASEK